ncbi:MAG: RES domain-containing protein [Ignavibacteria bacterium]
MEVFRLSRKRYAKFLSGKGSARFGGRWNSTGVELIYTASNRSLAMAEVAVHLTVATVPDDYQMTILQIPDSTSIKIVSEKSLPKDWNIFPPIKGTQLIGDRFVLENVSCLLKVPSAVTKGDYNILINPLHKEFGKIKITDVQPFSFDMRLFK